MKPLVVPSELGNGSRSCLFEGKNQHVSISVLLCLVFCLGFLLNTFSLWVFCFRMRHWAPGTVLQFHLALSDAIAMPVLPMLAYHFGTGHDWIFGSFLCTVKISVLNSHFYGNTIFLMLISIHRYTAVVHFNKSCRMKSKVFLSKLCGGIWILLLVQALIYAFLLPSSKKGNHSQCLSIHQTHLSDSYFVINFILVFSGFLLPFLVLAVCYGRLAGTLTHLNLSYPQSLKVKRKSQRMIGMCLLIFGLSFLPLNVVRSVVVVLKKYYRHECQALLQSEQALYGSLVLAGVNSCLDPLLYCFGSQKFRDAFRSFRILRRDAPKRSNSAELADQQHGVVVEDHNVDLGKVKTINTSLN